MDRRHVIGKRLGSPSSPARGASGQGRDNYYLYRDQGPSSYNGNSYYARGDGGRYMNRDIDVASSFENLENCRAELLRKLDELKNHLSRSCEVFEKNDVMVSPDPYPRSRAAYLQEALTTSHVVNQQRPRLGEASGYAPYVHRDSHFRSGYQDEGLSYANTYQEEIPRGAYGYDHSQTKYLHQPYHDRRHGYGGTVDHPDANFFHNPTCSCVHCFDKDWDLPPHVLANPDHPHRMHPIGHEPQGYSGGFNSHSSHSQPSITPNSTDIDFENAGIHQTRLRNMQEARRNGLMMRPVAGGAPFIACTSCFESLRLPKQHFSLKKRQQKLKCGTCSSVFLFELGNKALTLPVSGSFDHVVTEMDDCSSLAVDGDVGYEEGGSKLAETYACSDSNDDSVPKVSLTDKKSSSDKYEKNLDSLSSVSSPSKDRQMEDTISSEKHGSSSAKLHIMEDTLPPEKHGSSSAELHIKVESLPHPILSNEESPDRCSANLVVGQCDNGDKGTKFELDCKATWQNSVRDSAVSTEIESKEFPKSCISQDTCDKGAESSSSGHDDSRSGDFMKWTPNAELGTSQVFVNGHLIPENLVQKAELLAGPIQPGEYWYDVRAGFWGVMGFPCLGIIMPNIEEFNYPMPEKCAAGNTGVVVNGRELHQKDLDLLAGRGLPILSGRSYLVKISGEVIYEDTGEELDSIGKLAPSVERANHGFGMKVPRFISRYQS
ncbi:hypothetical protein SASPL_148821 [Salvia splendens]|uniref:Probable zinc-ribbon domain-containing protein n=1 Tax=Salvia splendens TaxID=180675 RepID=A0A8X8WA18_SALSN|nr:uncharacterized protein LOC121779900 [Salvia splendens]XP_042033296.1 uncharacterized protein LOC121779900 [Salvia splendens]KAG6391073.1 hypothetical protein SASPL_148821 [Salvia splendens]